MAYSPTVNTLQQPATTEGTIAALNGAVTLPMTNVSGAAVQIGGTWVGTLAFEGSVDGVTYYPLNAVVAGSSLLGQSTTTNNLFRLTPAGLAYVRVRASAWTSGTATIAMRGVAGTGGVFANQYLPTRLVDIAGGAIASDPSGALSVNSGHATLFYDAWSGTTLDTTDKWTVTGTAPTIAGGNMTMPATPSTYHAIRTKDPIRPNGGFTYVANGIALETATATGSGRFWGLGTPATTPAADRLVQDGVGFEVDQATGTLLAVTYAGGVRTTVATLARPTDGLTHRYALYFRVTQAFWHIDNLQAPVASASFPNVPVVELPALLVRQNAAAFTGTPAFVNIAHLTADTSRQTTVLADPVIGTRQARVGPDGSLRTSMPPATPVTATAAANTAVTLTLPAPPAGQFHYVTLLEFTRVATAALAGTAALVVTSTNLPGTPAWTFGNAMAAGGESYRQVPFAAPVKSSAAATATTIVAPAAGAGVLWRLTAHYYTGP